MEDEPTFDVDDAAQNLERQPTTKSGSVRKTDAMAWLKRLDEPSDEELIAAVTHKARRVLRSTFATPVSQVRVTGDATFIAAVAGLLKPMLAWGKLRDSARSQGPAGRGPRHRRVDRQLRAVPRCRRTRRQGKIASALLGTNKENDRKLLGGSRRPVGALSGRFVPHSF